MSAHSGLVDYERGRRIPPADLMKALVVALQPDDDRLTVLYKTALTERASTALDLHDRAGQLPWNQHAEPQYRCTHCPSVLAAAVAALEDALTVLRGVPPHPSGDPATGIGA